MIKAGVIHSAPQVFERRWHEVIEGLPGIAVDADDCVGEVLGHMTGNGHHFHLYSHI